MMNSSIVPIFAALISRKMQLSEQEVIRREKLTKLRELGINPYPAALYPVDTTSKSIKKDYKEGKKVIVAGRLMRKKIKVVFSYTSIEMKFVLKMIIPNTMIFLKNF